MAINFPTRMDTMIHEEYVGTHRAPTEYKPPTYGSMAGFYILNYFILSCIIGILIYAGVLIW